MNIFCLVLLGCAGCNVSFSDSCHAVHHRDGGEGALPTSGPSLAVVHRSMWRPQRRPQAVGGASSKDSGSFVGTSSTTRWGISFGNPSIPCGPCIQPCTSYSAHPGRRRLGQLEGILPLWRSSCTRTRRIQFTRTRCAGHLKSREEAEDEQHHRPGRRWRIHSAERRHEGCLVSKIPRGCWRMAPRGGRTHNGTIVRGAKEAANTGHSPICGLRHLRPLRLEGAESKQIQELHTDGKRLHHQRSAGSIGLHTVEGVLPNSTHDAHHVGCGDVGSPPQLRSSCGEAHPNLSHGVAPRIQCRRVGEVEPFEQTEITAPHGPEGWKDGPEKLGSCQTMGLGLSTTGPGRRLLADAGGGTSPHMAGSREPGHPKDPFGTTCDELHGRGPQGNHSSGGHEETTFEVHFKNVAKEEKKEQTNRRPRLPRVKRHRRRRRKERKEGQRKGRHKTKVLQLEQWYTTLWRFITWTNVCGKSSTLAPLHGLQFTRPPIEVLPKSNAGVNNHGEGHDGEGQKKEEAVAKAATPTTATPTRLKRRMTRRMKSEETKRTKTRRRTVMGARTKKNP